MTTPMQSMFPPKPKKIITPLTPKSTADAIRAEQQPKPKLEPESGAALEELEAQANNLTTKRTITRVKKL